MVKLTGSKPTMLLCELASELVELYKLGHKDLKRSLSSLVQEITKKARVLEQGMTG